MPFGATFSRKHPDSLKTSPIPSPQGHSASNPAREPAARLLSVGQHLQRCLCYSPPLVPSGQKARPVESPGAGTLVPKWHRELPGVRLAYGADNAKFEGRPPLSAVHRQVRHRTALGLCFLFCKLYTLHGCCQG